MGTYYGTMNVSICFENTLSLLLCFAGQDNIGRVFLFKFEYFTCSILYSLLKCRFGNTTVKEAQVPNVRKLLATLSRGGNSQTSHVQMSNRLFVFYK